MAVNKVVYGTTTLIDLTDSTLSSADELLSGVSAYDQSGVKRTGTVVIQVYYTGSGTPSSSLGSDGDIYLKVS